MELKFRVVQGGGMVIQNERHFNKAWTDRREKWKSAFQNLPSIISLIHHLLTLCENFTLFIYLCIISLFLASDCNKNICNFFLFLKPFSE